MIRSLAIHRAVGILLYCLFLGICFEILTVPLFISKITGEKMFLLLFLVTVPLFYYLVIIGSLLLAIVNEEIYQKLKDKKI